MLNKSLFLTSIALCLSFSAAKAQIFSTGTVTGDSSIEDVGTVVDAYAFNYGGSVFTINGVTFTSTSNINGTFSGYTANGPGIDGTGGGIVAPEALPHSPLKRWQNDGERKHERRQCFARRV